MRIINFKILVNVLLALLVQRTVQAPRGGFLIGGLYAKIALKSSEWLEKI